MTPIAKLVASRQEALSLDRKGVCRRLGYSSFGKACSRFDEAMVAGFGQRDFLERLARAIETPIEDLLAAANEHDEIVRAKLEREERESFRPCLWVVPSKRRPENITIIGMLGLTRVLGVRLPSDIADAPLERQLELAGAAARDHTITQRGGVLGFGRIVEYVYRATYDDAHRFSIEGQWLGPAINLPPQICGAWAGARIGRSSLQLRIIDPPK